MVVKQGCTVDAPLTDLHNPVDFCVFLFSLLLKTSIQDAAIAKPLIVIHVFQQEGFQHLLGREYPVTGVSNKTLYFHSLKLCYGSLLETFPYQNLEL